MYQDALLGLRVAKYHDFDKLAECQETDGNSRKKALLSESVFSSLLSSDNRVSTNIVQCLRIPSRTCMPL
jgi:hypothetical protein